MLILGNDKKCLHLSKGKCPGCWGLRAALSEECMGIAPSMCCLMSPHCPLFQGLREAVNSVRRDTFLCRFFFFFKKKASYPSVSWFCPRSSTQILRPTPSTPVSCRPVTDGVRNPVGKFSLWVWRFGVFPLGRGHQHTKQHSVSLW